MRSSILGFLVTLGAAGVVVGCSEPTKIESVGNLPNVGGAAGTGATSTTDASGGSAGSGGSASNGGSAGSVALPDCSAAPDGRCQLVEGHDIRALAADGTRLYWVEYGTEDDLGNPRYDGVVMAQDFDGGPPEPVSGDLPAPIGLQLSGAYFYVHVERWQDENGAETPALVRFPRGGGAAELVHAGLSGSAPEGATCFYPCFAATPGFGYYYHRSGIHRVSEEPSSASSPLWAEVRWDGFVASTTDDTVYFNTLPGDFQQLPFQAEEPEPLLEMPVMSMQWDAGSLYWLEMSDTSTYLVRWQLGDGSPRRIADVGVGSGPLKLAAGHYFVSLHYTPYETSTIASGSLAEPERVTTRVEFAYNYHDGYYLSERWVGTPEAIYWIEDGAILRAP